MAEGADIDVLRRERDQALVRARRAEKRAAFPGRAISLGVPPELVSDMDPDQSDEQVMKWVTTFRDYCARVTEQRLAELRPDQRRGNMLVQTAGSQQHFELGPAAPDWLRERVNKKATRPTPPSGSNGRSK